MVRAICIISNIIQNAEDSNLIDLYITGCILGPKATLRKGKFAFDIPKVNPESSTIVLRSDIETYTKNYLETRGVIFRVPDTVRLLTSII